MWYRKQKEAAVRDRLGSLVKAAVWYTAWDKGSNDGVKTFLDCPGCGVSLHIMIRCMVLCIPGISTWIDSIRLCSCCCRKSLVSFVF